MTSPYEFREVYRPDTPPAWKGSAIIGSTNVPATLGLDNANVVSILGINASEQRERRLILGINVPTLLVGPGYSSANRLRCGSYTFGAGAGVAQIGSYVNANVGLRMTCTGYTRSTLQCDYAPGIYRIPPCTDVKIEAVISRVVAGGAFTNIQLFAEIVDSCEGPVCRPMEGTVLTVPVNTVPGDGVFSMYLNPYCRWFDFHASATFGLATSPVFTAVATGYGPSIKRDYINNTWFPSGEPVDLGSLSIGVSTSRPFYTITNESTASKTLQVTQFLEW